MRCRLLCWAALIASACARPMQYNILDNDYSAHAFGHIATTSSTPAALTNPAWSMLFEASPASKTATDDENLQVGRNHEPSLPRTTYADTIMDVIEYFYDDVQNCKCFDVHAQPFTPPATDVSLATHCTTGVALHMREYYCYNLYAADTTSSCSFFCRCQLQ